MESPRSASHQPDLEQRKIIDTLALLPFAWRWLDLTGGVLWAIGIGLGLVSLLGAALGTYGGMFYRGAIATDVEEAIEELVVEWPDGDPTVILGAAIRILDESTVSTGPVTVETFNAGVVATRLGPALDYVLAIERFLLERQEIYPVFTIHEELR